MASIRAASGVPAWGMKSASLFRLRIKGIYGSTKEKISFVAMALAAHQRICLLPRVSEMNIPRKARTHPTSLRVKVWRTGTGTLHLEAPLGM